MGLSSKSIHDVPIADTVLDSIRGRGPLFGRSSHGSKRTCSCRPPAHGSTPSAARIWLRGAGLVHLNCAAAPETLLGSRAEHGTQAVCWWLAGRDGAPVREPGDRSTYRV